MKTELSEDCDSLCQAHGGQIRPSPVTAVTAQPRWYGAEAGRWGADPNTGLRRGWVRFPAAHVRVFVDPLLYEGCDRAALQREVDETTQAIATALPEVSRYRDAAEQAGEARRRADAARERAEARLALVLGERRRLHGPALVRRDELGGVWLLDPDKQWRGLGFRFRSLAELWIECPDLRPVAWGEDDDGPWMRVEQFVMPVPPAKEER